MQTIDEVMTRNPLTVDETAPVSEAARTMRDANIGDVLVTRPDGSVCGIVTDRDLALNVVAEGKDPASMVVRDVCNHTIESVELANVEPFKPTFGVKIATLKTTMTYSHPNDAAPSLPQKVTTHVRGTAFLFKSLDADMTVVYSDYAKARKG